MPSKFETRWGEFLAEAHHSAKECGADDYEEPDFFEAVESLRHEWASRGVTVTAKVASRCAVILHERRDSAIDALVGGW